MTEEKRRYIRVSAPTVVFYEVESKTDIKDRTKSADISEEGLRLFTIEPLNKGERLNVRLELPFDSLPIFCSADVAWVKEDIHSGLHRFEAGLNFIEMNPRDKKRLISYLNTYLQR